MKKLLVGMIAVALMGSMANVWAEDGEGEQKQKKDAKRERGQKGRRGGDRGGMLKAADKDEDGKITLEEFTEAHLARMKEMFDRMDVNKDGVISAEDRAARKEGEGEEGEGKKDKGDHGRRRARGRDRDQKPEGDKAED